jgi:hypothetical protein
MGTFVPICKNSVVEPLALAAIQTDGSFRKNISRTAVILDTVQGEETLVNTYFTHDNSHESEWCSVLNGLEFSLKKKQLAVTLENEKVSYNPLLHKAHLNPYTGRIMMPFLS